MKSTVAVSSLMYRASLCKSCNPQNCDAHKYTLRYIRLIVHSYVDKGHLEQPTAGMMWVVVLYGKIVGKYRL